MTKHILTASRLYGNVEVQLDAKVEDDKKQQKNRLSFLTAQKMIKRFLTCDRIVTKQVRCKKLTEQELAEKLSLSLFSTESIY